MFEEISGSQSTQTSQGGQCYLHWLGEQRLSDWLGGSLVQAQHLPAGDKLRLGTVLVRVVYDFLDSGLDYHLGALVAREQGNVDLATLDVSRILK